MIWRSIQTMLLLVFWEASSTGVIGDPMCASADPGKKLGKAVVEEAIQVRQEVALRQLSEEKGAARFSL